MGFIDQNVHFFEVTWRKAVRKLLWVHCDLLPVLINKQPIQMQLQSRSMAFIHSMHASKNKIVVLARDLCQMGSRSAVSNTMSQLAHSENIPRHLIGSYKYPKNRKISTVACKETAYTMRAFMELRDNCPAEDKLHVNEIVNYWVTL